MSPLHDMKNCTDLPNTTVPPTKTICNRGGILFLEVLELKEELCVEREELDYLEQQSAGVLKVRNALHQQNKEKKSITELYSEIEELEQLIEDLDEDLEIRSFETKMVNSHNDEMKRRIQNLLRKPTEPKPERRGSMVRRTSRYLRHQKRRNTAPLVIAPSA
eukprot:CAMPEP_0194201194 /NCGR_PEP_ID=MMETSP0156-20130528/1531_1 /TAXON_ID=33649 /ORGANISM="Thalassionema nitzschioides, Strain L26-B" /LENGTH=161 /DNA_ID=CAMNT_0038926325 /DNA_START=66 /DNA_END=551 /DNA_ORIENTATION=+